MMSFGSPGTGNGQFNNPADVAVDSNNNIFVTDSSNNRVQKLNQDGNYLMKFGTFGSGNGQFKAPIDLAIDPANNVYVSDSDNNRIQVFNNNGTVYYSIWKYRCIT